MDLSTKISVYAIPGLPTHEKHEAIINTIMDITGVNIHEKTRKRHIVEARQFAMYVLKHKTPLSLSQIGRHCGKKDHATVLHACKTVANLLETDRQYKANYAKLLTHFEL